MSRKNRSHWRARVLEAKREASSLRDERVLLGTHIHLLNCEVRRLKSDLAGRIKDYWKVVDEGESYRRENRRCLDFVNDERRRHAHMEAQNRKLIESLSMLELSRPLAPIVIPIRCDSCGKAVNADSLRGMSKEAQS